MGARGSMERDLHTYTIQDTIDEIAPQYREEYGVLIGCIIRTSRLTETELSAVNKMYARRIKREMSPLCKINCFLATLRQSGVRPDQYWAYLLPPEPE